MFFIFINFLFSLSNPSHIHDLLAIISKKNSSYQQSPQILFQTLISSIEHGDLQSVQQSIKHFPFLLSMRDSSNQTLLHIAIHFEHYDIVNFLIQQSLPINDDYNLFNMSPLLKAIKENHLDIAELLLDYGADIEAVNSQYGTPLIYAIEHQSFEMVKILLDYGASVDTQNSQKMSPLLKAVQYDSELIVEILLQNHANPYARWPIHDALQLAQLNSKPKISELIELYQDKHFHHWISLQGAFDNDDIFRLQQLIHENPFYLSCRNLSGNTLLTLSSQEKRTAMVQMLLQEGASVKHLNNSGQSALICALKVNNYLNDNFQSAQLLIQNGASVECRNFKGKTPLMQIFDISHSLEPLEFLVQNGADIHARDYNDTCLFWHALEYASFHPSTSSFNIVKFLLKKGVQPDISCSPHHTEFPLLTACKQLELVKILLDYGANPLENSPDLPPPFYSFIEYFHRSFCVDKNSSSFPFCYSKNRPEQEERIFLLLLQNSYAQDKNHSMVLSYITSFFDSIQNGQLDKVQSILTFSPFFLTITNSLNQSPLHVAVQHQKHDIIQLLLQRECPLDTPDSFGVTPLILAIKNGFYDIATQLLEWGASTFTQDHLHLTALDYSQQHDPVNELFVDSLIQFQKIEKASQDFERTHQQRFETFVQLIQCGDLDKIQSLIVPNDPCFERQDCNGDTLLHLSLRQGQYLISQFFLEEGASPLYINKFNETPLIIASQQKNIDIYIFQLLFLNGADADTFDAHSNSPLFYAFMNSLSIEVFSLILDYTDVSNKKNKGLSLMNSYISSLIDTDQFEKVKQLISLSPHYLLLRNNRGNTLLIQSIQKFKNNFVQLFIQYEVHIQEEKSEYSSPLMVAIMTENLEAVQLLVQNGANLNHTNRPHSSPLSLSLECSDYHILQFLIENGINLSLKPDILHQLCKNQWYHLIDKALEKGADPNAFNSYSTTPLYLLFHQLSLSNPNDNPIIFQCIQSLLDYGANPHTIVHSQSILETAMTSLMVPLLQILLKSRPECIHFVGQDGLSFLEMSLKKPSLFRILAHYDSRPQEEINQFFTQKAPLQTCDIIFEMIQVYQPSDDILLQTIPLCSFEEALLLACFLSNPPSSLWSLSPFQTLSQQLQKLHLDWIQLILILPSNNIAFYRSHVLPRFVKKYLLKTSFQKTELLKLLNRSFDNQNLYALFEFYQNNLQINPSASPSSIKNKDEIYDTFIVNLLCSLTEEDKLSFLEYFFDTHPQYAQKTLNTTHPTPLFALSFSILESSSSQWGSLFQSHTRMNCQDSLFLSQLQKILFMLDRPFYSKNSSPFDFSSTLKIILTAKPFIIKKWIEQYFCEFKDAFLEHATNLLMGKTYEKFSQYQIPRTSSIFHLTQFVSIFIHICLDKNQFELIDQIIPFLKPLHCYQKAHIFAILLDHDSYPLSPNLYPYFLEPHVLSPYLQEKVFQKMIDDFQSLKTHFNSHPLLYLNQPSMNFLEQFVQLCLQDSDSLKTLQTILEWTTTSRSHTAPLILSIFQKYPDLLTPQNIETVIQYYLSRTQEPPLGMEKLIDQHLVYLHIDFDFPSIESKVLFLSLLHKQNSRIQSLSISFQHACLTLACFVQHFPHQTLDPSLFFSHQELKALNHIRSYTHSLANPHHDGSAETFETELKELKLPLHYAHQYETLIYPFSILLSLRSFEINPPFLYKKPIHAQTLSEERKALCHQDTPFWELLAWINIKQPSLHSAFLKLFQTIWKHPQRPLFQRLKDIAPSFFLDLQNDLNLQDKFIAMIHFFENKPTDDFTFYEPILNQFIDTYVDFDMLTLPLELLSFISFSHPLYYTPFKQFLKEISHSTFFKYIIINEPYITLKLNDDRYQSRLINIFKQAFSIPMSSQQLEEALKSLFNQFMDPQNRFSHEEDSFFSLRTLHWMQTTNFSAYEAFTTFLILELNGTSFFKKLCVFDLEIYSALQTKMKPSSSFQTRCYKLFQTFFEDQNLLSSVFLKKNLTFFFFLQLEQLLDQYFSDLSSLDLDQRYQQLKKRKHHQIEKRFSDESQKLYLPLKTLNEIFTMTPLFYEPFQNILRKQTHTSLFKKLCIWDFEISLAFKQQDIEFSDSLSDPHHTSLNFKTKWIQLFETFFSCHSIQNISYNPSQIHSFLIQLEQLLDLEWGCLSPEKLDKKYLNYQEKRKRNKIHTGDIFLWYLKQKLLLSDQDPVNSSLQSIESFQLWKHRLLNSLIPHTGAIVGKEGTWYSRSIKLLKNLEKILTFEEGESRNNHLDILLNIVDLLTKCTAQSQAFFINAENILYEKPHQFTSLEDAFCDSAMMCRLDVLDKIITELVKNSIFKNIHSMTFVYKISLLENWGVKVPEGLLTEKIDPFAPDYSHTSGWVIQQFNHHYSPLLTLVEYFFVGCIGQSFYTSKNKNDATPYASAIVSYIENSWTENDSVFKLEDIIQVLQQKQLIQKKTSVHLSLLHPQDLQKKNCTQHCSTLFTPPQLLPSLDLPLSHSLDTSS